MIEDDKGEVWEVTDPNMEMFQLQPYVNTGDNNNNNNTTTQSSKDTSRHGHSSLDNARYHLLIPPPLHLRSLASLCSRNVSLSSLDLSHPFNMTLSRSKNHTPHD